MTMSSEERRRRVHRAVNAQKRGIRYSDAYRNNSYDDSGAQGRGETGYSPDDYNTASYRRPAGSSIQRSRSTGSGRNSSRRRQTNRRGRRRGPNILQILLLILLVAAVVAAAVFAVKGIRGLLQGNPDQETETSTAQSESETQETETTVSPAEQILTEAARLAAMYDYDGAIELINSDPAVAALPEAASAVAEYEQIKTTLGRQDISGITHVFYHILVVDPENAFDESRWGTQAGGYNGLMTTIPEFEKMLEEFYNDGYVLVRLHDMASMETQADGTEKMVPGDIMLPPGKKAMVMSQDDVCYYEYMEGAGFAERMIVGEDGRPTCVYVDENGTEHVGEYDLVPILDRFIDEHPDFSYKGAKACLAFTGYNGILGYRTDETYDPSSDMYDPEKTANPNIEADRAAAREVVEALRADGYELASHSWGHRDMGAITLEHMKKDTDRWDRNVNQELLGGTCDILIYPRGADVGDWRASSYSHSDNAKFDYLWDKGFRYFCNVDGSTSAWVQVGDDFLRQGRRPLDGYNMWREISEDRGKMSDLFDDVSAIFDTRRPTPVPAY